MVDFVGHASVDQWTEGGLLTIADVPGLAPDARLPIVNAMTCLTGLFAMPGADSLSESLLMLDGAGTIAVWSPTSIEQNDQSVLLGTLFVRNLFGRARVVVLGDAILASLRQGSSKGLPVQLLSTYALLGDPALKVRW